MPSQSSPKTIRIVEPFQIGYVLVLSKEYIIALPDTLGYVYECIQESHQHTYYGIFLESGNDLGLLERSEAERLFLAIAKIKQPIRFENGKDLQTAFETGYFSRLFSIARDFINKMGQSTVIVQIVPESN